MATEQTTNPFAGAIVIDDKENQQNPFADAVVVDKTSVVKPVVEASKNLEQSLNTNNSFYNETTDNETKNLNAATLYYNTKNKTNNSPLFTMSQIEYEYGEGASAEYANKENIKVQEIIDSVKNKENVKKLYNSFYSIYTDKEYREFLESKFGRDSIIELDKVLSIKLKRKILGDKLD